MYRLKNDEQITNDMRLIFTLIFAALALTTTAQSIGGKLKSRKSSETLTFGNVDIYKGEKLVASVLTDREGNFNVALADTGVYQCVFNYAGHKEMKKTIHVKTIEEEGDEYSMDHDPAKPLYKAPITESIYSDGMTIRGEVMDYEESETMPIRAMYGAEGGSGVDAPPVFSYDIAESRGFSTPGEARSGALTAGEVNDFSKWEMWQDYEKGELKSYADSWKFQAKGRYAVQLRSQSGLPLADAEVQLVNSGKVLFTSRTDNTGRAELWAAMTGDAPSGRMSIDVDYRGIKESIRDARPFTDQINYVALDVSCNEMNNVDIAFVVDATGSMGDELRYLKAEMNDIIFKSKQISSKLNFHFANVFYRDEGDAYVTRQMNFSRVLSESVQFINEQQAGGGGDYEEAVEFALDSAINNLSWNEEARARILFLILDAPPHNTAENQTKMKELAEQAAAKGIRIVPVGASGIDKSTEYLMRTLAISTNGTYTFLTNHSGIGGDHIEPTTDDYKVETFNDLLVRVLKSYTYMPDCEQNMPDLDLDYPDSLVTIPGDSISDVDTLSSSYDSVRREHHHTWVLPDVQWSYYPNPTTGIINITADVDIDELYLTDLSGKLLQSIKDLKQDRVYQMDLGAYTSGYYLIRYLHEDRWISGRVVLHR